MVKRDLFSGSNDEESQKVETPKEEKVKEVKPRVIKPKIIHESDMSKEDIEKRIEEQVEKKIQAIIQKEKECDTISDRLDLLLNIKSEWDTIKNSEISKWSRPKVEGMKNHGSERALTFVNNLDRFINNELERAKKIKKSCE